MTGQGVDSLLTTIETLVNRRSRTFDVDVALSDGQLLNWLYETCEVLTRTDSGDVPQTHLQVRVPAVAEGRFLERFPGARPLAA